MCASPVATRGAALCNEAVHLLCQRRALGHEVEELLAVRRMRAGQPVLCGARRSSSVTRQQLGRVPKPRWCSGTSGRSGDGASSSGEKRLVSKAPISAAATRNKSPMPDFGSVSRKPAPARYTTAAISSWTEFAHAASMMVALMRPRMTKGASCPAPLRLPPLPVIHHQQ
jgi:hypothetical protein